MKWYHRGLKQHQQSYQVYLRYSISSVNKESGTPMLVPTEAPGLEGIFRDSGDCIRMFGKGALQKTWWQHDIWQMCGNLTQVADLLSRSYTRFRFLGVEYEISEL